VVPKGGVRAISGFLMQEYHNDHYFEFGDGFNLSLYKSKPASFNEDARGDTGGIWCIGLLTLTVQKPYAHRTVSPVNW